MSGFASLYSFKGVPDGAFPLASLLSVDGSLYGTTSQGGSAGGANGNGTVFKIAPSGTEQVVYSFSGAPDGQFPQAPLTSVNGLLYGTTPSGGANSIGSVFTIAKTGVENVVYSFAGGDDGSAPEVSLTNVKGTFYGTTILGGGTNCASGIGCGTAFKVDPSGNESVLYRFQSGSDGAAPAANLLLVKGILYGTTFFGGGTGCNFRGCGTIFKIDPSTGAESVLYSFKGGRDGSNPDAGLIALDGKLYGTTSEGGGSGSRGTVFVATRGGRERVLHRFVRGDGADPEAGLLDVNGTFYGTTYRGGKKNFGTVFSIAPSGTEQVLYSFSGQADGGNPNASLISVANTLYGTTKLGGSAGFGTVFSLAL